MSIETQNEKQLEGYEAMPKANSNPSDQELRNYAEDLQDKWTEFEDYQKNLLIVNLTSVVSDLQFRVKALEDHIFQQAKSKK